MNKNVFVYGSNIQGIDGAGAALFAKKAYGRKPGIPMGLFESPTGLTYGIITKDLRVGLRSVSLEFIQAQVTVLLYFAYKRPELTFHVSRIGCGHAGFQEDEIAPMFQKVIDLGITNIKLCTEFYYLLKRDTNPVIDPATHLWKDYIV